MLDHVTLIVKDVNRSKNFFQAALEPLGYKLIREFSKSAGFGEKDADGFRKFWIREGEIQGSNFSCFAFTAHSKQEVDNFYTAALKAGGKDNGSPGYRTMYHPGYYAAFVIDPNGYNIEAVFDDMEKIDKKA